MELRPFITQPPMALLPEGLLRDGLHNNSAPLDRAGEQAETRLVEQPWHTHAARYFAMGMGQGDVARYCEVHPNTIGQLLKNAWFQERIHQFLREGSKDIMEVIRGECFNSINMIVEIRDSPDTSPAIKLAAAKDLADRYLGKAVQRVEATATVRSGDPVKEAELLEQENNRLREATL